MFLLTKTKNLYNAASAYKRFSARVCRDRYVFQRTSFATVVVCGASQGEARSSAANNSAIVKHPPYHHLGPWIHHTNYGQVDDFMIIYFSDDNKISVELR